MAIKVPAVQELVKAPVAFSVDDLQNYLLAESERYDSSIWNSTAHYALLHRSDIDVYRSPLEMLGRFDKPRERRCNIDNAENYIDDLESEYTRLQELEIGVAQHTTLFVPRDPSFDNGGVFYIAQEVNSKDKIISLTPDDMEETEVRFNAAIYVVKSLIKYLTEPRGSLWLINHTLNLGQYILNKEGVTLTCMDPGLMCRKSYTKQALQVVENTVERLPVTEDTDELLYRLNEIRT